MRKKLIRVAVVVLLIFLPFAAHWGYQRITAPPARVVVATGPEGGRYRQISENLGDELKSRFPEIEIVYRPTSGSLENLRLLLDGEVDFALYQPRTLEILSARNPHLKHPEFVDQAERMTELQRRGRASFIANLYSQPVHFVVRRDAGVKQPADLRGKRVSTGRFLSGDHAMSLVLLEHMGVEVSEIEDTDALGYAEIAREFESGELDAAIITVGVRAPVFKMIFETSECELLSIPYAEALSFKDSYLSTYRIPRGLFRAHSPVMPPDDVETVAIGAQMLVRTEVKDVLARAAAEILVSEDFARANGLSELFAGGREFARSKPDFAIHKGARSVYEPDLRPVLNSDFVEATEGIRSFLVSMLIALYLLYRWLRNRAVRRSEHQLDRFIRELLTIERRQLDLDEMPGKDDVAGLQRLLDEVTRLRGEALGKFSAHQISEDRATDTFLEMCHALSDKINAKLTRQRTDAVIRELADAVRSANK